LKDAIKAANKRLDRLGIELIRERVTRHSLRRSDASVRAACGDDPVYIAKQLGHTDMNLTFRIYQQAVKRRGKLAEHHLREFARALQWAKIGRNSEPAIPEGTPQTPKTPASHR
jgi:integrase